MVHASATSVPPVSSALAILLDRNGDGEADGAECSVPRPRGGGYGPARRVFDWNTAADRVGSTTGPTFNSFVHVPWYGDERNFALAARGEQFDFGLDFRDPLLGVADARTAVIRLLVENGANDALGEGDQRGVARNTRVRVAIATGPANGIDVMGYVSADNAEPQEVWDSVALHDEQTAFSLLPRPGSARLFSARHRHGLALPDALFDTGTLIGGRPDGR